jgi:hypothetical protein
MEVSDKKFQRFVIDRKVSMVKLFDLMGLTVAVQGNCYCMFHNDEHHKSAKLYKDDDGERLFCFAERRSYRASDVLETLLAKDVSVVFEKVWGRLSQQSKESLLSEYGTPRDYLPEAWSANKDRLSKSFRSGRITYDELMKELYVITLD